MIIPLSGFAWIGFLFFLTAPYFFIKSLLRAFRKYKKDREYRDWRRKYFAEREALDRESEKLLEQCEQLQS